MHTHSKNSTLVVFIPFIRIHGTFVVATSVATSAADHVVDDHDDEDADVDDNGNDDLFFLVVGLFSFYWLWERMKTKMK